MTAASARLGGTGTGSAQAEAAVRGSHQAPGAVPTWRRLLAESGPARGYLSAAAALGLAGTGLILAQAGLLAHILARAATGVGSGALRGSLLLLLAVVAGRAIAAQGGEATALRAAAAVKQRLRSALTRQALRLGPGWLGQQRPGEIAALGTGGLESLDPYFSRYLPQLGLAVVVPAAVLATVTAADWISGVIIAATLPLIPLFAALVGQRTRAQSRRSWQVLARLSGHFLDVVQGLATLKLFGRAAAQEHVIAEITTEYRASVMATLRIAFLSALVLELSASLATALVAVEVGLRLLYGHMGYATALFVLLLTPEAYLPLRNASAQFHASADGLTAAGRVFEILDTPAPRPAARPGLGKSAACDLRFQVISFNKVSVTYPGRPTAVLAGLDLIVRPGERITITGPSGAGKTTLLSLLLRFTEPTCGWIDVGGEDLRSVPAGAWREQVAWLPQHPVLFGWTVAENIALGRPGAPTAAVERAATLAGAAGFIGELPTGYDTVLDERALRLSAGQRKKIALARLFLKDAPLLLLDEPTEYLDRDSAAAVSSAIGRLAADKTVIVVSHRWEMLDGPGRTLLMRDGVLDEPTPSSAPTRRSADRAVAIVTAAPDGTTGAAPAATPAPAAGPAPSATPAPAAGPAPSAGPAPGSAPDP